jgi:hypothetical protein
MWKNTVQPDRPHTTIGRMRIACWIPKATNTHSEYVILVAFPLQQWLHERASVLRYTHIASLDFCSYIPSWNSCHIFLSNRQLSSQFCMTEEICDKLQGSDDGL